MAVAVIETAHIEDIEFDTEGLVGARRRTVAVPAKLDVVLAISVAVPSVAVGNDADKVFVAFAVLGSMTAALVRIAVDIPVGFLVCGHIAAAVAVVVAAVAAVVVVAAAAAGVVTADVAVAVVAAAAFVAAVADVVAVAVGAVVIVFDNDTEVEPDHIVHSGTDYKSRNVCLLLLHDQELVEGCEMGSVGHEQNKIQVPVAFSVPSLADLSVIGTQPVFEVSEVDLEAYFE